MNAETETQGASSQPEPIERPVGSTAERTAEMPIKVGAQPQLVVLAGEDAAVGVCTLDGECS